MTKKHVTYTKEIADQICDYISSSFDATLEDFLSPKDKEGERAQRTDMPTANAVMKWRHRHPEFKEKYDSARKTQAQLGLDFIWNECKKLRDWPDSGKITPMNAYSNYIKTAQYVFEKRFWRYSVERRLEALEEKLGVKNEGA
jgi:hypothetical protein